MPAAIYDIVIEQGSVFTLDLVYKDGNGVPIDLTGFEARMQVRQKYNSPDPAALSLSTADGTITLGGPAGSIHVEAPATITKDVSIKTGFFDLELVPDGDDAKAFRLVEGEVRVRPEVTR